MDKQRILLVLTGIAAFLLVSSLTYTFFQDSGAYQHYTGLGKSLSVSPDDGAIAFPFYQNGQEAVYLTDLETSSTRKITNPEEKQHLAPVLSPDGQGLSYLAANDDGVQSLYYMPNINGSKANPLTEADSHVFDAAFSPDGSVIFYVAAPAEDFLKREGEAENGADLFSVNADGSDRKQLTDQDAFSISHLSVSGDGTALYYTKFNGSREQLYSFNLETGAESIYLEEYVRGDIYSPDFSSDGNLLAYTAVSNESVDTGLFVYELFLMNTQTGATEQLTDFGASVTSPVFYHDQSRIAFLRQTNWASEPSEFELMTVDYTTQEVEAISLDIPESENEFQFSSIADRAVSSVTVAGLYIVMLCLLTSYFHFTNRKSYLPTVISVILTGITFAASLAAVAFNPWMAIGLFSLTAALVAFSIVIFIFAFLLKRLFPHNK